MVLLMALAQPAAADPPDVACGATVETSIELTHDLTDCQPGQNGLTIGANGVTVDLKGYNITGKSGSGIGIDDTGGFRDVEIKGDGTISGFDVGISAQGASGLRISDAMLRENGGFGLRLSGVTDSEFSGMTVDKNAGGGAWFGDGSSRNKVSKTSFEENGKAGLVMVAGNANVLSGNWANRNAGDGIVVEADASNTRLSANHATDNKGHGFSVRSASSTITSNAAENNHKLGISAAKGVHDGGHNSAHANGDSAQCAGVACSG